MSKKRRSPGKGMKLVDGPGYQRKMYHLRIKRGLCPKCGSRPLPTDGHKLCAICRENGLAWWKRNKDSQRQKHAESHARLKEEVFNHYGMACACCGEYRTEFLTIDHIDGNGAAHRAKIGSTSRDIYLWLRRNKFPKGFRTLCMNCNFSLGIRGYCPHDKENLMDKYGVVLDPEKVKQANDTKTKTADNTPASTCPRCGKALDNAGACPEHGTEPFEPAPRSRG